MMNIKLNLLSPRKKNRLEYLTNFLWFRDILELVILTFSVLTITLIWSWLMLEQGFEDSVTSAVALDRASFSYNEDVRQINKVVKDISAASQDYAVLTPKILDIISITPNDIKINSLQIDRHSQTVVISGSAQTRTALLQYQDLLKNISWIGAIETPASQLFQKENINFEFNTKLIGFPKLLDGSEPAPPPPVSNDQ